MSIFTGAAVALITPMHEDGSINYEEMERIVNDQINCYLWYNRRSFYNDT